MNAQPAAQQAPQPAEAISAPLIEAPAPDLADPRSYAEVVKLFAERREGILEYHLAGSVRLVRFEPGVIEINPLPNAPPNLANRVGSLLSEWTGRRWVIGISSAQGEAPLAEAERAQRDAAIESAKENPVVRALMETFPGAAVTDVRDLARASSGNEDSIEEPPESAEIEEAITDTGDES
jgi:DNA polymerase-3 subunit gamma/tau